MKIIFIIIAIVAVISTIIIFIACITTNKKLLEYFKESSVIVFGSKGKGKDLIFQKVIYMKRKKSYMSNCYYGYNYINEKIRNMSTYPNTFKKFINDDIKTLNKNDSYEGVDYYISDAGVFLPSMFNGELNKNYPSLPIYYALSRHLYVSNIHMNTQFLGRAWNLLREQADKFIKACGRIKIGKWIFVRIIFYDKYESAISGILPMKKPFFLDKYGMAQYEQFKSTCGEVKRGLFLLKVKHIRYDTRHFHNVLFGYKAIDSNILLLISSLTKEEIQKRRKLRAQRKVKHLLKLKYLRYLHLILDTREKIKQKGLRKKYFKTEMNGLKLEKKRIKKVYNELKYKFKKSKNLTIDDLQKLDFNI